MSSHPTAFRGRFAARTRPTTAKTAPSAMSRALPMAGSVSGSAWTLHVAIVSERAAADVASQVANTIPARPRMSTAWPFGWRRPVSATCSSSRRVSEPDLDMRGRERLADHGVHLGEQRVYVGLMPQAHREARERLLHIDLPPI